MNSSALAVPSSPERLAEVERFVRDGALEAGFSEDKTYDILLAVSEAATNALKHGNKYDPAKSATVTIYDHPDKFVVSVLDEGEGFDPDETPDPTAPENLLRDSGRGLYLMRVYADNLEYRTDERGVEAILTFKK